jgi:hypothetical protein
MCALNMHAIPVVANTDANDMGVKAYVNPGNMFWDAKKLPNSGAKLKEQMARYLGERKWELGISSANPGNAYIGWRTAMIRVEPDDVKYGQARITAFDRALTDAKGDFVLSRRVAVATQIYRKSMNDDLPKETPQADTDKFTYISDRLYAAAEKGMDLGEAYLDRLLREVGINPTEYQKVDRAKRRTIFSDAIEETCTTQAHSSLTGLRIVTTFEDLGSVGVLVMYSPESERIAHQVVVGVAVSRRPPDLVKNSIQDVLAKAIPNDADYIAVHGVRIMQDDSGENVLVAFGQWAPNVTKTTSKLLVEGRVDAAREMARSRAEAALTDFINTTLVLERASTIKEFAHVTDVTQANRIDEVTSNDVGARVESIIRQNGSAKLEGVTTIKTWTVNNPRTGHILVGHVLMWSPSTRDAARGKILKQEEGKRTEKVKYDNTVIEAPALDHLDPTLRRE